MSNLTLKSQFKFRAFLVPFLIIAFTVIIAVTLKNNLPIAIEEIRWIDAYMVILFSFSWFWLVFGELRTKIIVVTIHNNQIEKKNYLGLNRSYNFRDFDGYQTSILSSKNGRFEYLYLVKDNQKIIKISEAYHKNYFALKNEIAIHSKDLGMIQFSYIDEFKEIFK